MFFSLSRGKLLSPFERYAEEAICGLLLCGMTFFVFLEVVMRSVFHSPLAWTDEAALYCMVWVTYFGASLAVRERAHIRLLNAVLALPEPFSTASVILSDAVWIAFNLLMLWEGILLVQNLWQQPFISPALGINQKWPYMIIPLGFALMTIRMAHVYYRWFRYGDSLTKARHEEPAE